MSGANFAWFSIKSKFPAAVEEAMRYARSHAGEYNVDPKRIALIGESAEMCEKIKAAGNACEVLTADGAGHEKMIDRLKESLGPK